MKIRFRKQFIKQFDKAPVKIQEAFYNRIKVFRRDPFSRVLHNHKLMGRYNGFRSINITGDWRVIFREYNNGDTAFFYSIGSHSELYK